MEKRITTFTWAAVFACLVAAGGCKRTPHVADPLAVSDTYPEETQQTAYVTRKVVPKGRPELTFQITVPKDWREDPSAIPAETDDSEDLMLLARFVPPEGGSSRVIDIAHTTLPEEIGLSDFVDLYGSAHDLELIKRQTVAMRGETVEDLFVRQGGDHSFVARMTFRKHAADVFCVIGGAGEAEYPDLARTFEIATVLFRQTKSSVNPYAVPFKLYVATDGIGPSFHWPSTWNLAPATGAPPGRGAVDVRLNRDDTMAAQLRVKWEKRDLTGNPNADAVLDSFSTEFAGAGGTDQVLKSTTPVSGWNGTPPSGQVFKWVGRLQDGPVAMRAAIFDSPETVFSVTLLTVTADRDPIAWAAGARAFEIAVGDVMKFAKGR